MYSDLPTSGLQTTGLALEVLFPSIALMTVCLRVYVRLVVKNWGWGKFEAEKLLPLKHTLG